METKSSFSEAMEKAERTHSPNVRGKARTWLAKNPTAAREVGITTVLGKAFSLPMQAALDLVRAARGQNECLS